MKKILVTGCNGQLGKEIIKKYQNNSEIELVCTDYTELDITNIDNVIDMVRNEKPYAIINCAAHTAVDKCETDIDNAFKINSIGPRNLSISATEVGAKIVHISTDYVFDGLLNRPYNEFDNPNPQSVYGKTKLEGENFVKQFSDRYFIIRTAWLYGDGKNFVKTMLELSKTKEIVNVVSDQIGSPTSARTLTNMIDNLVFSDNYGLFHGTCEGVCSWAEFAKEIFAIAKKQTRVEFVTSKEYNSVATRPANSVLDNYMLRLTSDYSFPHWKDEIERYLKVMEE